MHCVAVRHCAISSMDSSFWNHAQYTHKQVWLYLSCVRSRRYLIYFTKFWHLGLETRGWLVLSSFLELFGLDIDPWIQIDINCALHLQNVHSSKKLTGLMDVYYQNVYTLALWLLCITGTVSCKDARKRVIQFKMKLSIV